MTRLLCALFIVLLTSASACAWASDYAVPDYLTLGGGDFDFDKHNGVRRSGDMRLEYQWGTSLLPKVSDSFLTTDPWMQMHPTVGLEANANGLLYASGGFNLDVPLLWRHVDLSWGENAGFYSRGNDPENLGSILEFRSQLELGWRFATDVRMSAYISHLSNAHITRANPGGEVIGGYLRLPLWWDNHP